MSYNSIASVGPYYDDFDPAKNYHRILFQPGYSVQARELTQSQTILQNQITNFADNIFAPNSPVSGGQVTTNLNCNYVRLLSTYNNVATDVTKFYSNNTGIIVRNSANTVVAQVIAVAPASGSDSPTLILSYKTGTQFSAGDIITGFGNNSAIQSQIVSTPAGSVQATGQSSVASVSQGVFYVLGTFVQVNPQTIILDKYDNTPNSRIGLTITEATVTSASDSSLLDPALGASNYQAPGADRYQINLTLSSLPLSFGGDTTFVELVRLENGVITKKIDGSVYSTIDDYFAKRDYETNGDYVVHDFVLTPKANTTNNSVYTMSIGPGVAYVHGYRTENLGTLDLTTNRARTTQSLTSNPVFLDYGSYFFVNTLRGANADFFNVTSDKTQPIELHCVSTANANTYNTTTYNATVVASGYMRNIQYDHVAGSDTLGNTYVYRAYVHDLQLNNPSGNVVSATANTIVFPGTFSAVNDAYTGVTITINKGTDVGDFRTIASYNGSTRTATVTPNWIQTPDTTSGFSLNFDIKDAETIIATQTPSHAVATSNLQFYGTAVIDNTSKYGGVPTGAAILQNPGAPELVFPVGNPYANNISNQSYTTQLLITGQASSNSFPLSISGYSSGAFKFIGTASSTLSSDLIKQNFLFIVTAVSTNPTYKVGDLIPSTAITSATLNGTGQSVTFVSSTIYGLTLDILIKVQAVNSIDNFNGVVKYKNLITGNTTAVGSTFTTSPTGPDNQGTNPPTYTFLDLTKAQVYIQKAGLVSAGQPNSLYVADVKRIVKIIDTGASGTAPTNAMLTSSSYDVTNNFIFDNGQRDNFYDFASVTLRPGAPQPNGNLLVIFDFYDSQKTGSSGDGYFNLLSYTTSSKPEAYQQIPQYVSKHGTIYNLRDCIDFRPQRLYGQTKFVYYYFAAGNVLVPSDLSTFNCTYSYYLGRQDKLVLSKDKSFQIIEGTPSLNPVLPSEPDGSLVIASMTHNPYTGYLPTEAPTGYLPDLSINRVKHKRYTMEDIAGLESRINHIEYYTALNLLEQNATSLQTPDAYGLNRFKNGILVDNFQNYATADTFNADYNATVNARTQTMTATQRVGNYPLKSLVTSYNMSLLANTVNNNSLGYAINTDGFVNYFTLPYTSNAAIIQPFASRNVNVNPFAFANREGVINLSPNVDNWVDTSYSPSLLVTDPNLQVFQASNTLNILSAGDWQTIPGTLTSSTVNTIGHNINPSPYGYVGYSKTTTYEQQSQTNVVGNYSSIGNTYGLDNGYITNISVLPYIRQQTVVVRAKGMLQKTTLTPTFDNTVVTNYFRKANIIELSGVTGQFMEDDVVGYYTGGVFTPTARILGVYNYVDSSGNWTNKTRLYVASDGYTSTYTVNNTLQNAYFDSNYNYVNSTASGTFVSSANYGGQINNNFPQQTNFFKLSPTANTNVTGNTLYITAGTGAGQSATISNFFTANNTALLSTSITCANGDIYSIGTSSTDESGSVYGVFCIPGSTFHTGQRVLRFDNSVNQNLGSATTYAEGTFYAQGLSTQAQQIDFGSSPAGAKGTFTRSQVRNALFGRLISPWDPVAQTFMVAKDNYPNGMFLNSVQFYFASKPAGDSSPVTLSIVGTQNGYPDGKTLDGSIVTLTPDQITTTSAPYTGNNQTATVFTFSSPVYIQPEVLYSFILKSTSSEYTLWSAAAGDTALLSSTNGIGTKIGSAPYVGALFLSQNSQTWTADQNQSLTFVVNQCLFNTSVAPSIPFVVPKKLPQRTIVEQSITQVTNANNYSSQLGSTTNTDQIVDAFNISTTDFTPTTTGINYSFNSTLASSGAAAGITGVNPGKYGTTMYDNLYLTDSRGERILQANSNSSFTLYTQLTSSDPNVSPMVSDAGLSVYTITWNINNCELSNSLITVANTGSGYNAQTTSVTVSTPITGGNTATAVANVVGGQVVSVYITSGGSNYLTTPTITITDSNTTPGVGANVIVSGETSPRGGPALAKYVTKKVVLDPGYDSGDLNVYLTAYRPVNTDINVYYKILNRNDTQTFESGNWQLMTKINNSGIAYSQTRTDTYEYVFAPGNYVSSNTSTAAAGVDQGYVQYTSSTGQVYTSFSQFAIKVVMTSSDHTFTPFLSDLRVLALPASINTTV